MPNVAARKTFKGNDDARDHAGIGAHGIFPSGFGGLGRNSRSGEMKLLMCEKRKRLEATAIENLEFNEMEMDGSRWWD
jgi:hypothetical protein